MNRPVYPRAVAAKKVTKRKRTESSSGDDKPSSGDELLRLVRERVAKSEAEIERIRREVDPERARVKHEHRFASSYPAFLDAVGYAVNPDTGRRPPTPEIVELAAPIHYMLIEGVRDGGPHYKRVIRELCKTLDRLLESQPMRSLHMEDQLVRAATLFHAYGLRDEAVQRVVAALAFAERELLRPLDRSTVEDTVRALLERMRPDRNKGSGRSGLSDAGAVVQLRAALGAKLPSGDTPGVRRSKATTNASRARKRINK